MLLSRCYPRLRWSLIAAALSAASLASAAEPGLLFYLSGDKGTTADVAAPGTAEPTFVAEVKPVADGAKGGALECGDYQRLAYRAPGNIYAQHGTLSFFWRSRYPVGPTEFPVFRVGYADHSSWDMVWLRIDYNGHGFDAFVTDANLSRVRVSVPVKPFPAPGSWTHLAISWDETSGIRFYVNGKLAAENKTVTVLNTALDAFGPHSRIISPYQVQSDYNFTRGGDIDEVRIYDRMLDDSGVATLAKGEAPKIETRPARSLADATARTEWLHRYGWDHGAPPALPAKDVSVRKVEITDVYDLKRWWWKATDGIPETTWPGVYNRSRLPGRHDYFTLPDWDCYVDSGKAVTFALPDEPWNHLEISGAAWGKMELLPADTNIETASEVKAEAVLFERAKGQEKTAHALTQPLTGREIRFTNVEQEQPISELSAYNVTAGQEPAGSAKLAFQLQQGSAAQGDASLAALTGFVDGRFAADERTMLFANALPVHEAPASAPGGLPIVHVLVANSWDKLTDGLDGIALDLPAFKFKPTHGGLIAFNVRVKDPLWPMRDMLNFSFSVKPGEAHTLWLDLRDRLLPAGRGLYLEIASASPDFNSATLEGSALRLVFKPRDAARPEHELDRFTQARDSYAMLVEEHPASPKLNMWVRFKGDLEDLLRVNPDHVRGRQYAAAAGLPSKRPDFIQPAAPAGVPLWAFRQTYLLGQVQRFVDFYIDHRQSAYGDFGGGISDDVDLLNTWPGVALMGAEPDKIALSDHRLLEAAFTNGMFTNGLPTIQADELHSYEEGINCLAQNLIVDYGSPRQLERAMATARGIETITGVNAAGHRHIRTSYYSGTRMAEDGPWGWSKPYSYLVCQVPQLLVEYNGNPAAKKIQLELADGLLAHRRMNAGTRNEFPTSIHFSDDAEGDYGRGFFPWHMFWAAWQWTGDRKYLGPIVDSNSGLTVNANTLDLLGLRADWAAQNSPPDVGGRPNPNATGGGPRPGSRAAAFRGSSGEHFGWQVDGDKSHLERLYAAQIESCAVNEFIETEGSLWIDRVGVPTAELQRARLGGVALLRNSLYPGHAVSWKFAAPATGEDVAILVPDATRTGFKVIAYNLSAAPISAEMTGWSVDPGTWEITQGVDTNGDDVADESLATRTAPFERARAVTLTLPSHATTVLTFKLKTPGTPYWSRPDLGLDPEDVTVKGHEVRVTVHSVGAVPAPATTVVLRDATGRVVATEKLASLAAPLDLLPKTATVTLKLPKDVAASGCTVEIDPEHQLDEITMRNNAVKVP